MHQSSNPPRSTSPSATATAEPSGSAFRLDAATLIVFAVLVVCLWAWYALRSGMGYETVFPFESESGRGRHFVDLMRRFAAFFYHLAYTLGSWLGHAGSYVPYQIVYALLWLLRGVLVFQIVRMLGDREGVVAFFAGAFTILHAADTSLNWVGLLNHVGFLFWMLLAFVVLLKCFALQDRLLLAIPLAVVATQLARICIYTYESPLPLIFAFPVLVLTLFLGWSWRRALLLGIFLSLPVQFVWRWLSAAIERSADDSYQYSVLRQDWSPFSLLGDWAYNAWYSLAFWQWSGKVSGSAPLDFPIVVAVCAGIASALLIAMLTWLRHRSQALGDGKHLPSLERRFLALGLAMVVLSFPAYLLLDSATSHWRTQLLSGPGAGIAYAAGLSLLTRWRPRMSVRPSWLAAAIVAAFAVSAVWASQASALRHRLQWDEHRAIAAGMLSLAPRVREGTVLLLVNRRSTPLVFEHDLWWDYAVRLAYPGHRVAALYFDEPAKPAPGATIRFQGSKTILEADWPLLVQTAYVSDLIILEAQPQGMIRISEGLPDWLGIDPEQRALYDPYSRVLPWPPDPRAVRRFGPIERK